MIQMNRLFQDNMILQRQKPIPVSGTADPGSRVTVEIQGVLARATADTRGEWHATLPALEASGSETFTVTAGGDCLRLLHVAVGEIWVAGGQSNMEFWMRYERHRDSEGRACPRPDLRFFDVPKICYDHQREEFDYSRMGIWRTATEEDLDYFSAVAYYFQKELAEDLALPVGIIGCNWGGTIAAAWMDPETVRRVGSPWMEWFRQIPEYRDMDAYLAAQHGKPVNDHGNPFGDLFLETVLPRTLGEAEARTFLDGLPEQTAAIYDDYMNHPQPQSIPGSLYEHMVKEIAPFPVRGVLWYQGEGDEEFGIPAHYRIMLGALIEDWRRLWMDASMPFFIVQIPGFSRWLLDPPGNRLAEIRRCQEQVCDEVPGTWLCSASDAGEETDAHPKDKSAIGHRLALLARRHVYGEPILSDAPRLAGIRRDGSCLTLHFVNAGEGLSIKGGPLRALSIFEGEKIHEFESSVNADQLVLTLKETVSGPLTVSFAQTSWYCVNLYNSAGIPAIPFACTI